MLRSVSDIESGRIRTSPYMAQRGNQILTRTPAVTKELLQRLQNAEVAPKKYTIGGYVFQGKQLIILIALFFLFLLSIGLLAVIWGTNIYSSLILSMLVISNNTNSWLYPSPGYMKIYIFNYTNTYEVEAGYADKLEVNELGPYVYKDIIERVNVKFSDDGSSVTYQNKHSFEFIPEQSIGRLQNDKVTVPNLPLLGAAAMGKDSYYFTRLAMSSVFKSLNAKPFVVLAADRFILGYDDDLYSLAKGVLALTKPLPYEQFGLLSAFKGVQKDVLEVYTGKGGLENLNEFKTLNKKDALDFWLSSNCNEVKGSAGVIFPPESVSRKSNVDLMLPEIGRRIPFEYEGESRIFNGAIPTYRYVTPHNMFGHPSVDNPANQCYCDIDGDCPPHGLFNATKTSFGTPVFYSNPHFLNADPQLREVVNGLQPDPEKHQSYMDLHPLMGFMAQGWTRLQSNIQVMKSFGITELTMLEDQSILPIAWMEVGIDATDHNDTIKQIIYDSTYLVSAVYVVLQYGSILMTLVTMLGIILFIRRNCDSAPSNSLENSEVQLMNV